MNSIKNETALIAYVPTPHAGYLRLFRAYAGSVLYVLGDEFIREFQPLVRHLPGAKPEESQKMVQALGIFSEVHVLTPEMLVAVRHSNIVMPDEDVSHEFRKRYLGMGAKVSFDGRWRLRWDWGATQKKQRPETAQEISIDEHDQGLMQAAYHIAARSPDWWRQIGALLVSADRSIVLAAYNQHVPSEQSAYCFGDPRSNCEPGRNIELSNALHAEAGIIAEAAHQGICTTNLSLYVTTFPCPPCAYLCAFSGIRRLYYAEGYALVAGAEVLQAKGVEIVHVQM